MLNSNIPPSQAAQEILEVVPLIMRSIRAEIRSHRAPGLSVPQFRALVFVNRNRDASLSEVAEHLGLTLSSTSKLVDGLVKRGFVRREDSLQDRRRMILTLTDPGKTSLDQAATHTRNVISQSLSHLTELDRSIIVQAMQILNRVFMPVGAELATEQGEPL